MIKRKLNPNDLFIIRPFPPSLNRQLLVIIKNK